MALRSRLRKLESEHAEHFVQELAPEDRALAAASHAERIALARYLEEGEAGRPEFLRLWEEILGRVSPVLAGDVRCERDLLMRQLERIVEQWEEEGRHRSTAYSDPEYWRLSTAKANRAHALQWFGAPVIEGEEEARAVLETIFEETDTRAILQIVGRT